MDKGNSWAIVEMGNGNSWAIVEMGEAIFKWSDAIWAIEQMPFGRSYTYCQQSQCTHLQCLLLQKLSLSLALKCILAQRIPAFTLHSSSAGPGAAVQYCSKNFDFHFCCAIQHSEVQSSSLHSSSVCASVNCCAAEKCIAVFTLHRVHIFQQPSPPYLHTIQYLKEAQNKI